MQSENQPTTCPMEYQLTQANSIFSIQCSLIQHFRHIIAKHETPIVCMDNRLSLRIHVEGQPRVIVSVNPENNNMTIEAWYKSGHGLMLAPRGLVSKPSSVVAAILDNTDIRSGDLQYTYQNGTAEIEFGFVRFRDGIRNALRMVEFY